MFTVSIITSPLKLIVFFPQIWWEGGSCMQNAKTSFVCRWFWKSILSLTKLQPKTTIAECNQEGCKESDLYGGSIWWFTSLNFEQMMVKVKFVESNTLKACFLSVHCPGEQALYMVLLWDSIAFTSVIGKKWYRKWVNFTGCYSYSVLQCRGSCLSFQTKDRERQGDVKKKKKKREIEGEKVREAVWAWTKESDFDILFAWCTVVCCPADYDKVSQYRLHQ